MTGTFGGANFREMLKEAIRIGFRGFKFCDCDTVYGDGAAPDNIVSI